MAHVKTAISLEKSVYQRMETLARDLDISRSRLLTLAMTEFLDRHDSAKLLQRIDDAFAADGDADTAEEKAWTQAARQRLRSLTAGEW